MANMNTNNILTLGNSEIINVENFSDIGGRKRTTTMVTVPTLADIMIGVPKEPTWREGGRKEITHYGTGIVKNNFGTLELANYKGTNEDLIRDIGADFTVKPYRPRYENPLSGVLEDMGNLYLFNEKTGQILNNVPVSERYEVLNFEDCMRYFFALVEEIRSHGYEAVPDVARVYDGGNKMFLQYKIHGDSILGEPMDTNLTMMTSHDKVFSFVIALSQVRLFCKNQINRMLRGCDQQIKIRHTKIAHDAIAAKANNVIEATMNNKVALEEYLGTLRDIKVNDQQIYDAWLIHNGINKNEEMALMAATKLTNRMQEYFACLNMPDVANWKNTALGAYYAYTDYNDHVVASRQTATEGDNRIKSALYEGNPDVGNFIDTLVKVAG